MFPGMGHPLLCSSFSHEASKGIFTLFPKTFQKVAKNQTTYLPTLVIRTPNHFRIPALGSGTWMWCQGQRTKNHLPVQGDLLLPLALHPSGMLRRSCQAHPALGHLLLLHKGQGRPQEHQHKRPERLELCDRLQGAMKEFRNAAKAHGDGVRNARAHPQFMFVDFKGSKKCCFSHTHDWHHSKAAVQHLGTLVGIQGDPQPLIKDKCFSFFKKRPKVLPRDPKTAQLPFSSWGNDEMSPPRIDFWRKWWWIESNLWERTWRSQQSDVMCPDSKGSWQHLKGAWAVNWGKIPEGNIHPLGSEGFRSH